MTREEALAVLRLYKQWNEGQKSCSLAFGGPRTDEDDVYDARRALILDATRTLAAPAPAATRTVDAMGRKPSEAPERAEEAP